ncbi:hypothetical protein DPSP01_002417 [Paraphaeosphaeria sporulosa]|uniref:Fungal N-terminal domain-containing protein n=1 Tax=Paraphaeosphaeria sporulosa TaxID=1460663 RepID=A0A177C0W4_9PLEO|nr:uncharacterized protein CC84DRAFT_1221666 [Paraphaeosphaeria sporulosa]OAG01135.1 hypothetical protein CC84DRAFT_1221666 [Paraphaeosphaeria sporulosa]
MEVLGGIASVTQLAVYTHTAWRVFTRLYAELKGGPVAWQEQATNLEHLIQVTKRISCLSEQTQLGASEQIAKLVHESLEIAEEALRTIARAKAKVLGVRWSAAGKTELLSRTLKSLKAKRELLLFVLSQENLFELASIGRMLSRRQGDWKNDNMEHETASHELISTNRTPKLDLEMVATQVGNGATIISNNGLGHILSQIHGSVKLRASSAGDGVAVNTNNVYMEPDVIKKQLEIAETYARNYGAERREKTSIARGRAKSAEPKQQRLTLNA